MTPSETSVGGVLNRLALQTVTAKPDSSAAQTLNGLLYQDEAASRRFTKEVTSEGRAQLLSNSPLTRLTSETVYSRLDAADYSGLVGAEFKRSYDKYGGWGGSVGYKRVLSGVNPELNGTFAGDTMSGNGFTIQSDNDKNFVTYSLNVHGSLGGKWTGQAELRGEASPHAHKEIISVAAKYHF